MRIGVFVVMAGRKAGGPETYELCLLRGLAKIDRSNEYHVFCLSDKSRASIGINQDNFFFTFSVPPSGGQAFRSRFHCR